MLYKEKLFRDGQIFLRVLVLRPKGFRSVSKTARKHPCYHRSSGTVATLVRRGQGHSPVKHWCAASDSWKGLFEGRRWLSNFCFHKNENTVGLYTLPTEFVTLEEKKIFFPEWRQNRRKDLIQSVSPEAQSSVLPPSRISSFSALDAILAVHVRPDAHLRMKV